MTHTAQNVLRRILQASQVDLGNGTRNREALAIDASPEDLDRIQQAGDRDCAMRILESSSHRLHEVQAALRRMDTGGFGICVDCGAEINPKRLAAVPWASSCLVCQEAADGEQRAFGSETETSLSLAA